ncbi:apolipoprotein N-acyltransferase [Candidatus Latescibacterota bacterium]
MKTFLCAASSGLLLCCSFPPVGLGFLAYVAIVPMFFVVESSNLRAVSVYAWISGLVFLGLSLSWIRHITWVGMILAVLILALFYAIPFICAKFLSEFKPWLGLLIFPFSIAGIEWIRSFDQLAFPWMIIGNSQTYYPWLIQFADITSAYGVSCWVAAVNVSVYILIKKRSTGRFILLTLLFVVPLIYSRIVLHRSTSSGNQITVALIQGNVTPEEKWGYNMREWNINLYRSLSIEAAACDPDLIVWPETAIPSYLSEHSPSRSKIHSLVDSLNIPVFTGVPTEDINTEETWNSAGLFIPGEEEIRRYHKIHLVPFGEAIPLDNIFPILRKIDFDQANWNEGAETVVFEPPGLPPFNAAICFESIFPDLIRKFIVKGSQFIVVITNDIWFGPFASPIQHAMISVMRAIEFHRPIIRCANTGISMIIDSNGNIVKRTETFKRTTLVGSIVPSQEKTVYARFGNIFSLVSFVIFAISNIYCFIIRYYASVRKSA